MASQRAAAGARGRADPCADDADVGMATREEPHSETSCGRAESNCEGEAFGAQSEHEWYDSDLGVETGEGIASDGILIISSDDSDQEDSDGGGSQPPGAGVSGVCNSRACDASPGSAVDADEPKEVVVLSDSSEEEQTSSSPPCASQSSGAQRGRRGQKTAKKRKVLSERVSNQVCPGYRSAK